MDTIDSLVEEHATLRRLAEEIERCLGAQSGVGWDDHLCGDMPSFCAAQRSFAASFKDHEAREERLIHALLRGREADGAALEPVIERAHGSLEAALSLLQTLSSVCDGRHVHAVRTVAGRLRDELEAHLSYEEQVLFPLLRAAP